ncbi:MAG: hypothetical protein ACYSR9_04135 [Planctomycetota bacterium]|jgi:hypothetical protein
MDSEDIYRYKSRPALEALKLQAEEHLTEFAPLEGDQPVRLARRSTVGPDQIEYKSKGPVRELELMFEADEDEI